ncbi:hypothetical protein E4U40_002343 [Claviceps sp. LM458 group G5]|nr:hypothetical protein E4U40_002343 [Claviceps sp. LM458 group G5]
MPAAYFAPLPLAETPTPDSSTVELSGIGSLWLVERSLAIEADSIVLESLPIESQIGRPSDAVAVQHGAWSASSHRASSIVLFSTSSMQNRNQVVVR